MTTYAIYFEKYSIYEHLQRRGGGLTSYFFSILNVANSKIYNNIATSVRKRDILHYLFLSMNMLFQQCCFFYSIRSLEDYKLHFKCIRFISLTFDLHLKSVYLYTKVVYIYTIVIIQPKSFHLFYSWYVQDGGGGIFLQSTDVILENTAIYNNTAYTFGGGAYVDAASLISSNAQIYNNLAVKTYIHTHIHGGIYMDKITYSLQTYIYTRCHTINTQQIHYVVNKMQYIHKSTNFI